MRKYVKKLIGTLTILGTLLATTVAVTPPEALAAFVATTVGVIADGVVTSVGSNSFVMQTSGGQLMTIHTSNQTVVLKGPVDVGDQVGIVAKKRGGQVEAQVVRVKSSSGGGGGSYGTSGPAVSVRATVVSKTATTLRVSTSAGQVTYQITASTKFVGDTFAGVGAGDKVIITGKDTGSSFVANLVVVQ